MPPADTRRAPMSRLRASSGRARLTLWALIGSACTFYLVFKEPALLRPLAALSAPSSPRSPPAIFPSGEPCNLTECSPDCQLFSRDASMSSVEAFETRRTDDSDAPP